jgi:hypothetical protein
VNYILQTVILFSIGFSGLLVPAVAGVVRGIFSAVQAFSGEGTSASRFGQVGQSVRQRGLALSPAV